MTQEIKDYIMRQLSAAEEDLTRHTGKRPTNEVSVSRELYIHLRRHSSALINGRPDTYTQIAAELGYSDHTPAVKAHKRLLQLMSVHKDTHTQVRGMEDDLRRMVDQESRKLLRAHYGSRSAA